MLREKIILSNKDIEIMKFLKEVKFIKDISIKFDMNYAVLKGHLNRIENLNVLIIKPMGNFKKLKLNDKGIQILEIFKNE